MRESLDGSIEAPMMVTWSLLGEKRPRELHQIAKIADMAGHTFPLVIMLPAAAP